MNSKRKYLLWFAHEHIDFKFQEIASLQSLFNIPLTYLRTPETNDPYLFVEAESEDQITQISQRSVTLRCCLEIWAHATNVTDLHETLKKFPRSEVEKYLNSAKSFKIEVETFGKHFTQKEKITKLDAFDYLQVTGKVNLKNPDVCLHYIEYYGSNHITPPDEPYQLFFGRWISNGLRQLIKQISLKTRKFIGNTSMDPQLSLLMANQAKVKNGDFVLDTFVGSGSLLVAAASFGGYVLGTDIDYLMLHARTRPSRISQKKREKDESVLANMQQYNLESQYLDVLVQDFATNFWRDNLKFDSIITDPPYGIREAIEKIGTKKENYQINVADYKEHYPEKVDYGLSQIYLDLLVFSSKHLKIGGRLVCWFPIFREDYIESGLPQHPCLSLVGNSEQILSRLTSRRLLTYEKVKECDNFVHLTEGLLLNSTFKDITDFRTKFYETREETRHERRTKKALLKEQGRIEAKKRQNKDVNIKE